MSIENLINVAEQTIVTTTIPEELIYDDLVYQYKSNYIMTVSSVKFNSTYDIKIDPNFFQKTDEEKNQTIVWAYIKARNSELKNDTYSNTDNVII
jgi:hypothetical protein